MAKLRNHARDRTGGDGAAAPAIPSGDNLTDEAGDVLTNEAGDILTTE